VLLFRNRFLFTGDHLAWDRHSQTLEAFEDYCWYSWERQARSMQDLSRYAFEWVLPGHGQRVHLPQQDMQGHLNRLAQSMTGPAVAHPSVA
jgi:glyoxylase-like metal-dependent hydrolase (beta-lactamase superfamily II)